MPFAIKMVSFVTQPVELVLRELLFLDPSDFKNMKLVNRQFYNLVKQNEKFLHKKKLEQKYGKWINNPELLLACTERGVVINDLALSMQFDTIFYYIEYADYDMVKFLIKNDIVDVNIEDETGKPLLVYLFKDFFIEKNPIVLDCIHLFLEKTIKKELLELVYYYACQLHNVKVVKRIVEKGVNTTLRNSYGWSPQMYAIMNNSETVVSYLSSLTTLMLSDISELVMYKVEKNFVKENNIYEFKHEINDNEEITSFIKMFTIERGYYLYISDCYDNLQHFFLISSHILKYEKNTNKIHIFMKICNTINHYYSHLSMEQRNSVYNLYIQRDHCENINEDINNSIYKDIFHDWTSLFC